MKALGANVARVHLQFGKFMQGPSHPNRAALRRFARMLKLAEATGLYLDVTGLACYRPSDVPKWYDAMDERARWAAQANFWAAVAEVGASSPAVFCYDLINEPLSPGGPRPPGQWGSGSRLGGYDFLQFIALYPAGHPAITGSLARLSQATTRMTEAGPFQLQVRVAQGIDQRAELGQPLQAVEGTSQHVHGVVTQRQQRHPVLWAGRHR